MRDCTPNLPTDMRLLNKIAQPVARRAPKSPCKVLMSRTQRGKMFPGPGQATVLGAVVFQGWASAAGLQLRHSRKLDPKKREACLSLLVLSQPSPAPALPHASWAETHPTRRGHMSTIVTRPPRPNVTAWRPCSTGRRKPKLVQLVVASGCTSGAGYFENSLPVTSLSICQQG